MKNNLYILLAIAFSLQTCQPKDHHKDDLSYSSGEMAECSVKVHSHETMKTQDPGDGSVFHLESVWKNQTGKDIILEDFGGKITIVSMIYTHCQYACPRIVADMEAIKKDLALKGVEEVNYVLISLDPARDTPDRLMEFHKENKFDDTWTLLCGDAESVMEMAAVLGVKFKAVSETDYSHSNLITILSPGGDIMHRQEGLGSSPDETVEFISINM